MAIINCICISIIYWSKNLDRYFIFAFLLLLFGVILIQNPLDTSLAALTNFFKAILKMTYRDTKCVFLRLTKNNDSYCRIVAHIWNVWWLFLFLWLKLMPHKQLQNKGKYYFTLHPGNINNKQYFPPLPLVWGWRVYIYLKRSWGHIYNQDDQESATPKAGRGGVKHLLPIQNMCGLFWSGVLPPPHLIDVGQPGKDTLHLQLTEQSSCLDILL